MLTNYTLPYSFEYRNGLRQSKSVSLLSFALHVNDINEALNRHTDNKTNILLCNNNITTTNNKQCL